MSAQAWMEWLEAKRPEILKVDLMKAATPWVTDDWKERALARVAALREADPNAAMIARDGPAKAAPVAVAAPADAPKLSPAGLTWSADLGASSHQVDWRHGTAMRGVM